ncbi:hypothetical protein [Thiofilum flexile]|uniref:hypothetical protein n=1 Tax=Thiofilum flexile TaxID=125627 RepID=UPI00036BAD79|nr:hypothetical protein [Thiofilum flexile]
MLLIKYLITISLALLLMVNNAYALVVAPSLGGTAYSQNKPTLYSNPTYQGNAVDICLTWATNCGKPAADYFCRLSLGSGASSRRHTIVYDAPPTILPKTGQRCTVPDCDRFASITCSTKVVIFRNPTVNGVSLDICTTWATNCGKPAADLYCLKKGYSTSVSHEIAWNSPPSKLFSGQACNGSFCDRFTEITCR